MEEKIKVGDPIQGFGGFTHPNGDMLHSDVDLAPDIDNKELSEEDLKDTTIELVNGSEVEILDQE